MLPATCYLVRRADHIRELESIIMRIAHPAGNAAKGRLPGAKNLKAELDRLIRERQDRQRRSLLWGKTRTVAGKAPKKKQPGTTAGGPTLAPYINKPFWIRATYKGKVTRAYVNRGGTIRLDGKLYNSPSSAGKAIVNHGVDGWHFWKYRNRDGEWVKLDELRKKSK